MNIFNIIVDLVLNGWNAIANLFNNVVGFVSKLFVPIQLLFDFLANLLANTVATIIETITAIIRFFGGNI